MSENHVHSSDPFEVALSTKRTSEIPGDAADQADRLTMIMDAEAAQAVLRGDEFVATDDHAYPLEDIEDVIAAEDADDSSDDPMHGGGMQPGRWVTAEESAMHVIGQPDPREHLTPEDLTMLGIDPY